MTRTTRSGPRGLTVAVELTCICMYSRISVNDARHAEGDSGGTYDMRALRSRLSRGAEGSVDRISSGDLQSQCKVAIERQGDRATRRRGDGPGARRCGRIGNAAPARARDGAHGRVREHQKGGSERVCPARHSAEYVLRTEQEEKKPVRESDGVLPTRAHHRTRCVAPGAVMTSSSYILAR